MERTSALSTAEIVGVAAASAAALGGVIVALGRSQANHTRERTVAAQATQVPKMSRETVERGRDLARSAAESIVAHYPELKDSAADLLHRASETAQRASETARPRASQVGAGATETAEHVRQTGAQLLDRIQADVIPAASTAISGLVDRASEARERSAPVAGDIKSVAAAKAEDIKTVAVSKADVALTKSTSAAKDSLATVVWTTAALTLVYVFLLSPERREQLKTFLWGAVDQSLALVRDFQGYEDDF